MKTDFRHCIPGFFPNTMSQEFKDETMKAGKESQFENIFVKSQN